MGFHPGSASLDRAEISPIPAGIAPLSFSGPDSLVTMPTDLTAAAGATLTVLVTLDSAAGLESVRPVELDTGVLRISNGR